MAIVLQWVGGCDLGAINHDGATSEIPFLERRKAHLGYDPLKKVGLTKQRILSGDCLFFYQLVLRPFHETHRRITDNDRKTVDPRYP
jgi:hypothetical protein